MAELQYPDGQDWSRLTKKQVVLRLHTQHPQARPKELVTLANEYGYSISQTHVEGTLYDLRKKGRSKSQASHQNASSANLDDLVGYLAAAKKVGKVNASSLLALLP